MPELVLLSPEEARERIAKIKKQMQCSNVDAILISDNANTFYLTGRVFAGFIYIPYNGNPVYFIRRPIRLSGNNVIYIRKLEQIAEYLEQNAPQSLALELDITSFSTVERIKRTFPKAIICNASPMLRIARSIKTKQEIEFITTSGKKQESVYRIIPQLYKRGMTDLELQVEIERASRLEGCLGQFRISGDSMELYMGNILVGENADNPTPYDFAMGGEGQHPSLPVGANGSIIKNGNSIMVDVNGNYTGYMTDMTRTFYVGNISKLAQEAHTCSIDICKTLALMALPGVEAKSLYEKAESMARDAGLQDYFMGHLQKAGFVGHGVGIEINELPVIAPRSRDVLQENNVFALEPKFVVPGVGAVGIENTYVVTPLGATCLTNAPEEIIEFI